MIRTLLALGIQLAACVASVTSFAAVTDEPGTARLEAHGDPAPDSPPSRIQSTLFEIHEPTRLFSGIRPASADSEEFPTAPLPDRSTDNNPPPLPVPPVDFQERDPFPEQSEMADIPATITDEPCVPEASDIFSFDDEDEADSRQNMFTRQRRRYTVYRSDRNAIDWLPAGGEQFGWLEWQSDPYLKESENFGVSGSFNVHWLSGPGSSPLPPRLYDFVLGLQHRQTLSEYFSYDVAATLGAYSDFEDSARDGIRFPAHAVGMLHLNRATDFVFGVDYLDRDDIALLPVIGLSLRDRFSRRLRMDLVFPRPRIDLVINDDYQLYLTGRMSGGTWDIEFPDETNQVMTYRDYRIMLGLEHAEQGGSLSAIELGIATGRHLQFRDGRPDAAFDDAFVIQWVTRR